MNRLTKLFAILGVVVILGGTVVVEREKVSAFVNRVVNDIQEKFYPCGKPVTYKIGTFDTKFGISRDSFLQAIAEAEAIWEKPYGQELFAYDAMNGEMNMNLLYDYRQETTSKLENLNTAVEDNNTDYETLRKKYVALVAVYTKAKSDYQTQLNIFNEKYKSYKELIAYWNARGGAPKKEYDQIQADQAAFQNELAGLKATESKINDMVAEINSLVAQLNRLGANLNQTVAKYNTIGATLGESFEEGLYVNENGLKHIDIYEFKTHTELVRVLAHELGHALGLDHVSDPAAIMYKFNQAKNGALSKADLVQLEAMCGTN